MRERTSDRQFHPEKPGEKRGGICYKTFMNIRNLHIKVRRLEEQGKETDLRSTDAAERLGMMWQLAQDAWAFMGEPVAESRLSRHLIRILRRKS